MKAKRRLAAILFADIVGFTALMQADENHASTLLRHFQQQLEEKVAHHNGRIVNFYGDGVLCTFQIPIDAVRCAMALQSTFQDSPKTPVRIGIHSGTVTLEGDKIFGDSVNITSRVESMGVAGGILCSKKVRDEVKNNPDLQLQLLGSFEFKNVEEPMEVYAIANAGFVVPGREAFSGKFKEKETKKVQPAFQQWFPVMAFLFVGSLIYFFIYQKDAISPEEFPINDKSIAVLPFTDLSPNRDQEYFSVGMMDEILNHLVKIQDLQVSSKTSSMQFVNTNVPITSISKELGVANILEGSVRKSGDQVRITVQLIDGKTDKHLWSETYDRRFEDIFGIQSDVAQSIANVLKAKIYPEVKERIEAIPTENMEAYDLWLRAINANNFNDMEVMLQQVIQVDTNFASAYAMMANIWLNRGGFAGNYSRDQIIPEVTYYLNKALEKDENNALAHRQKAQLTLWYFWDFESAQMAWNKYLKLNPSSVNANLIDFYSAMGEFERAKEWAERINLMYRKESIGWSRRALPYSLSGDDITANRYSEESLEQFPNWYAKNEAARVFTYSGNYEKVISIINTLITEEGPEALFPRALGLLSIAHHHAGQAQKAHELLEILALKSESGPTGSPSFYTAMVYAQFNQVDRAFQWLEKSYKDHELEMYWMKVEPPFEPLHDDPRWEKMLNKVGFPKIIKG